MTQPKWMEEFEKEWERSDTWEGGRFGALDETWDGETEGSEIRIKKEGVIDFIRQVEREAYERCREVAKSRNATEKLIKEGYVKFNDSYVLGFEEACQDIAESISRLIGEDINK